MEDNNRSHHHHHHQHRRHHLDDSSYYYRTGIDKMRILLLIFAMLFTFDFDKDLGDINAAVFSFAIPALFIISGYLVLRNSQNIEQRILRTLRRTAACFLIMLAANLAVSLFFAQKETLAAITSKSFWADFILLNKWSLPVGSTIWFVQALLYAYAIIYVLNKLKLLKFDIYIAAICLVVSFITGDIASLIGFNFMGSGYIGDNVITRALPYVLLGCFIHRKKDAYPKLRSKHFVYAVLAGAVLIVAEYILLAKIGAKVYVGHLIGTTPVAFGVAMFALKGEKLKLKSEVLKSLRHIELMIPYYICSPIYYFLIRIFALNDEKIIKHISCFAGVITVILSFVVLFLYSYIKMFIKKKINSEREH